MFHVLTDGWSIGAGEPKRIILYTSLHFFYLFYSCRVLIEAFLSAFLISFHLDQVKLSTKYLTRFYVHISPYSR